MNLLQTQYLQYLYQHLWPARASFFIHKCTVLFFHYTPTPDLRLRTIQFAPPCLSLFHFGSSMFNWPPQGTTQFCSLLFWHSDFHDSGPHTLTYYNEQLYIALFKTTKHFFILVFIVPQGGHLGVLLRKTADKCVRTDALIDIEMFVSASCLSTTAEDRTASSGPPPTLDVMQPAPGMVSFRLMFSPCSRLCLCLAHSCYKTFLDTVLCTAGENKWKWY